MFFLVKWWKPWHLEGHVKWDSRRHWKYKMSIRRHQPRWSSSLHHHVLQPRIPLVLFSEPALLPVPMAMPALGITDPIPLWKDVGTAQPSAIKGTPPPPLDVWAPGFMWGATTSKRTQLFQALHSFSSLNTSRPPERHSGRLQSTAQVERDLF